MTNLGQYSNVLKRFRTTLFLHPHRFLRWFGTSLTRQLKSVTPLARDLNNF